MNRLTELREQIAQQNKGLHYLKQAHESDFVEPLCAEIDDLRSALAQAKQEAQGGSDFRLAVEELLAKEAGETDDDAVTVLVRLLNAADRERKANAQLQEQIAALRPQGGPANQDSPK